MERAYKLKTLLPLALLPVTAPIAVLSPTSDFKKLP